MCSRTRVNDIRRETHQVSDVWKLNAKLPKNIMSENIPSRRVQRQSNLNQKRI